MGRVIGFRRRVIRRTAPLEPGPPVVARGAWRSAAPASASALSFVVGPALVVDRVGGFRVRFATLAAVVTLAVGAAVQPLVPRIVRLTRGRHAVAGLLTSAVATAVLALDTRIGSPVPARRHLYSLTYLGFALPLLPAELAHLTSYACLLIGVAVAAVACAAVVARGSRLPAAPAQDGRVRASRCQRDRWNV